MAQDTFGNYVADFDSDSDTVPATGGGGGVGSGSADPNTLGLNGSVDSYNQKNAVTGVWIRTWIWNPVSEAYE